MTGLNLSLRAALVGITAAALLAPIPVVADPSQTGAADREHPSSAMPEDVLTLEEAARLLRVDPEDLERLATHGGVPGRRIGTQWRFSRRVLQSWLAGLDAPRTQALQEQELSSIVGRGPDEDSAEEPVVGEQPAYKTADEMFLRNQRVLLGRGQLLLEPLLAYSNGIYPAVTEVAAYWEDPSDPLIFLYDTSTIDQDTLTAALVARYGILDETELFGGIVYEYQRNTYDQSRRETDSVVRGLLLGIRRTMVRERLHVPDVILAVRGRIPILHSSHALRGDLWLLKSFDPIVLLGSLHYERVFSRDFDTLSRLEPENTFGVQLGYAFAVNDELTLSTSVSGLFVGRTEFSKAIIQRHEEYNLRFALTTKMGSGGYVEPSVSFGLNGPGTRVTFGLSFPYVLPFLVAP